MSSILTPSAIARQIAAVEDEIAASNQRLRGLQGNLRASARHALHTHRVPLMVGGIALVTWSVLNYQRKRAVMARARWLMRSTAVRALTAAVLPMLASLMANFMAQAPDNHNATQAPRPHE